MTHRDLRLPLFRLATALVFAAAIGLIRTQSVYAVEYGTCAENYMNGCDFYLWSHDWCAEPWSCNYNPDTQQMDLCYCMSETYCDMWPGGCP